MLHVQRRRTPVAPDVGAIHDHLRLILRLGAGESAVHVEALRPGVVEAELQAVAKTAREIGLQSLIGAVAFSEPEKSGADVGIGAVAYRNVLRALRDAAAGRAG